MTTARGWTAVYFDYERCVWVINILFILYLYLYLIPIGENGDDIFILYLFVISKMGSHRHLLK